jgi:hypothetical protein
MRARAARHLAVILTPVVALALSAPVLAQGKDEKKLKDNERKAAQFLMKAVDHAMASGMAPGTALLMMSPSGKEAPVAQPGAPAMTWRNDALRAGDGKAYMPFTVFVEPGKLPAGPVAAVLRAAPKGATPPEKDADKANYPWQDFYYTELAPGGPSGGLMLTRVLQLGAGTYDVYLAMRPFVGEIGKEKQAVPVVVFKGELAVENYATVGLTTSSVLLVRKVEDMQGQVTPDMQRERPYIMGSIEMLPSFDGKFKKTDEFTTYFQIYNASIQEKKPDLTVEYAFYRKQGSEEKYFNKTNPQQFNAKTLPPAWDPDMGHVISAGQSIPLASFPAGDYRLEIKVTDNRSSSTINRTVNFSVSEP